MPVLFTGQHVWLAIPDRIQKLVSLYQQTIETSGLFPDVALPKVQALPEELLPLKVTSTLQTKGRRIPAMYLD
ncbi:hypothetical protein [uncultured Rhodoferax sp.]|uniref:hypothetical protein n=1 Tax=uncultured Rhodoferax sp. TaxID=223188 RepID=UPI0025DE08F5|nr:hypothetical protein [uncultured Rhodoferax sp.]